MKALSFSICLYSIFLSIFDRTLCDHLEENIVQSLSDSDCIELIKINNNSYVETVKTTHMTLAMRKGLWKCAKEIVHALHKKGIDNRNQFDMESRLILKEIQNLKSTVESSLPMSSINPAFQWAQSPNEVYINVKFAHKIDAPATLNVEANNVTLLEGKLFLQASDGRKNFILDIELLGDIIPDESFWTMASVGRMVFTLKKQTASKWTRLLKNNRKIQNMHFWWEMN